jgi:hypothetical protein
MKALAPIRKRRPIMPRDGRAFSGGCRRLSKEERLSTLAEINLEHGVPQVSKSARPGAPAP